MNRELMKQCVEVMDALREWIAAVPADIPLPAMPGVDGDWLDSVHEALKAELEKPEPEPYGWTVSGICRIYKGDYAEKATKDEAARCGVGYKAIPLYAAPTEPNCKFPTCHSQEYQDKLVQEILGQEPVAWLSTDCIGERYLCFTKPTDNDHVVPLYTKGK